MAACMLVGVALGMGYSFLHHANKARKERLAALVRIPPLPVCMTAFPARLPTSHDTWLHAGKRALQARLEMAQAVVPGDGHLLWTMGSGGLCDLAAWVLMGLTTLQHGC
jgi:hypothetical protein